MSAQIVMPQLGESVVEGTVVKWFVAVGDKVSNGSLLLEVETDKANAEVPATADGYIARLLAKPGDVIAVGAALVELSATPPGAGAAAPAAPAPIASPAPSAPPAVSMPPVPAPPVIPAMPAVPAPPVIPTLAMASPATAPWNADGVVAAPSSPALSIPLARGIEAVAAAPVATGAPFGSPVGFKWYKPPVVTAGPNDTVVKFTRRRGIISEHMVYSKHVSPHVPCFAEVDMSAVSELRRVHKKKLEAQGVPLTILAFLLKATTIALREFPTVNAVVGDGELIQRGNVNLGVAVETDAGLVVPVIRDADKLSVGGLATAVQDMATKARDGKITPDDLAGGTFTVSNPGRKGNLFGAAIINQPQVGIVRMGEIVRRPVVREIAGEEVICIRSMMFLSLSYDHRIIDGVAGNGFLFRIRELLEAGQFEI